MLDSRRVFLLAAAAILTYQLMIPPVVGLLEQKKMKRAAAG